MQDDDEIIEAIEAKRASGDDWRHLRLFAHNINTPRLIVRERECPKQLRTRLTHRLTYPDDEAY